MSGDGVWPWLVVDPVRHHLRLWLWRVLGDVCGLRRRYILQESRGRHYRPLDGLSGDRFCCRADARGVDGGCLRHPDVVIHAGNGGEHRLPAASVAFAQNAPPRGECMEMTKNHKEKSAMWKKVVVLLLPLCFTLAGPSRAVTVKIGVMNSTTGFEAAMGENVINAYKMALEDLKKKGINVEVVWEDDSGKPQVS